MKQVVIIVFPGVEALDVTGPASVFGAANDLRPGSYSISLASRNGGEVVTSSGVVLGRTRALHDLTDAIDTLLVAGGSEHALMRAMGEGVPGWLAARAPTARRVGSICSGAFILGAAGLLNARRATTHWRAAARLQAMFPSCVVESDAIYIVDGVYSSAGVTAGIDLALQLVSEDLGDRIAIDIARELVVFLRRSGGQSQYSGSLAAQVNASPPLAKLVEWISDNPTSDLGVPKLAKRAGMTERTFNRAFARETGTSPGKFVAEVRLRHAQSLLESTKWPLARVAERSGYGSIDALERAFRKSLRISPAQYRERFAPD